MDIQQVVALALVALAGIYLGRQLVHSARSFFSARGGCGSGCGKCGFARELSQQRADRSSAKVMTTIPLAEITPASGDERNKSPNQGIR